MQEQTKKQTQVQQRKDNKKNKQQIRKVTNTQTHTHSIMRINC
jgi:hypothetical protein